LALLIERTIDCGWRGRRIPSALQRPFVPRDCRKRCHGSYSRLLRGAGDLPAWDPRLARSCQGSKTAAGGGGRSSPLVLDCRRHEVDMLETLNQAPPSLCLRSRLRRLRSHVNHRRPERIRRAPGPSMAATSQQSRHHSVWILVHHGRRSTVVHQERSPRLNFPPPESGSIGPVERF